MLNIFWDTNSSPNLGRMTRPCNDQIKRAFRIVDIAVPAGKVLWTILKMDKWKTSTNGPENKKTKVDT